MKRDSSGALRFLVLPTIALVLIARLACPGRLELAVRVYALIVCAVALGRRAPRAAARVPAGDAARGIRADAV